MKKRFGIIAVTYREYFKDSFVSSMHEQSFQDFDLHIYHDGEDVDGIHDHITHYSKLAYSNVFWHNTEKRMNQFGHDLRDLGIKEQADKYEWLIITNCDNYYVPKFLEELNKVIDNFSEVTGANKEYDFHTGVIYFDYIHSHNRGDSSSGGTYGFMDNQFRPCICDIGAFAVRSDIAKEVGFNRRDHDADAGFIQDIINLQNTKNFGIFGLNKVLFVHN